MLKGENIMEKILVAVDGSEKSELAAQKAAELAKKIGAEVALIHVHHESAQVPVNEFYLSTDILETIMEKQDDAIKEHSEKIITKNSKFFEDQGVKVEEIIVHGDPADEVCDYAEQNDFDLIIVADKGQGKVERFLLGSTSNKIVRHSNVSVMVVK